MDDWRRIALSQNATIRDAIKCIDEGAVGAAIVIDNYDKCLGFITDGDIRRGFLKGITTQDSIALIMNSHPTICQETDSKKVILSLMKRCKLNHIPVVNENNQVTSIEILNEFDNNQQLDNWVIIMAGGKGQRLAPLTHDCPKPLLKIGGKPVLEISLEKFIDQGFHQFFFSVNYQANKIKDYFEYGEQWHVNIQYLEESQPLGTAGSLSLLPFIPPQPFIIMNGDIMTQINFPQLLDFHDNQKSNVTVCVREYQHSIPYGVVKLNDQHLLALEEKPVESCFVNAGIYVLDPAMMSFIPPSQRFDMPDLIKSVMANNKLITAFPIREYWLDIGRMEDFKQAKIDYRTLFEVNG